MKIFDQTILFSAATLVLMAIAAPALAESSAPYYRNSQEPAPLPEVPKDNAPGSIIIRKTIRAQAEPGVTTEIAPDSKQTATGGPSGGIPGASGH